MYLEHRYFSVDKTFRWCSTDFDGLSTALADQAANASGHFTTHFPKTVQAQNCFLFFFRRWMAYGLLLVFFSGKYCNGPRTDLHSFSISHHTRCWLHKWQHYSLECNHCKSDQGVSTVWSFWENCASLRQQIFHQNSILGVLFISRITLPQSEDNEPDQTPKSRSPSKAVNAISFLVGKSEELDPAYVRWNFPTESWHVALLRGILCHRQNSAHLSDCLLQESHRVHFRLWWSPEWRKVSESLGHFHQHLRKIWWAHHGAQPAASHCMHVWHSSMKTPQKAYFYLVWQENGSSAKVEKNLRRKVTGDSLERAGGKNDRKEAENTARSGGWSDNNSLNPDSRMTTATCTPLIVTGHQDSFIRFWTMQVWLGPILTTNPPYFQQKRPNVISYLMRQVSLIISQGELLRECCATTRRQSSPVTALCHDLDCNTLFTGDHSKNRLICAQKGCTKEWNTMWPAIHGREMNLGGDVHLWRVRGKRNQPIKMLWTCCWESQTPLPLSVPWSGHTTESFTRSKKPQRINYPRQHICFLADRWLCHSVGPDQIPGKRSWGFSNHFPDDVLESSSDQSHTARVRRLSQCHPVRVNRWICQVPHSFKKSHKRTNGLLDFLFSHLPLNYRVWWGDQGRFVGFYGQHRAMVIPTTEETSTTPILPYDISEVNKAWKKRALSFSAITAFTAVFFTDISSLPSGYSDG